LPISLTFHTASLIKFCLFAVLFSALVIIT
jgi:hypothetical protein